MNFLSKPVSINNFTVAAYYLLIQSEDKNDYFEITLAC